VEKDYPSAHSVDTMFYLIDDCGHVAACYTNESGALPDGAVTEISGPEDEEGWLWNKKDRESFQVLDPAHIHKLAETFQGQHRTMDHAIGGAFLILSDFTPEVEKLLGQHSMVPGGRPFVRFIDPSPATGGKKYVIVSVFEMIKEIVAEIHKLELCVSCTSGYHLNAQHVGENKDFVFYYGHPGANCAAHPYMLSHVPENPKTIDEISLSADDKTRLREGIRFSGCFRDKLFWQPADDFKCEFYGEEYGPIKVGSKTFNSMLKALFGYW